jgi:hypothetical protein
MPAQQVAQSLGELFTLVQQIATDNECGDDLTLVETALEENLTPAQRAVVNELVARIANGLGSWVNPGDDSFWHTTFAPPANEDDDDSSDDENENRSRRNTSSATSSTPKKGAVGKNLSRNRLLLHAVVGMCLKHATSSPVQGVWPAARLYLSILSIPGALSYRLYISELFQTTLRTLNAAQHPPEAMAKGIATSLKSLVESLSGVMEQDLRAHRWVIDIFCMYVCMYVCVRVYVCMYVCVYVCMYVRSIIIIDIYLLTNLSIKKLCTQHYGETGQ